MGSYVEGGQFCGSLSDSPQMTVDPAIQLLLLSLLKALHLLRLAIGQQFYLHLHLLMATLMGKDSWMIMRHSQLVSRNQQSFGLKSGILQKLVCRYSEFLGREKVNVSLTTEITQSLSEIYTFLRERQCRIYCRHSLYFCLSVSGRWRRRPRKQSIIQIIIILRNFMSQSNLGSKADRFNVDKSEELKRKRRTRNDEDGRNFSCNCGKSYLSYPALYTHIKTKHNGKAEFTKLSYAKEDNQTPDQKEEDEPESPEKVDDANNLDQLKKYLAKFFPPLPKDREPEKRGRQFAKEEQAFLKNIREYWEKHKKEDEPHENETYSTPTDLVLGKFLMEMESDVSKNCVKYLNEFALNVHKSLNQLKSSEQFCKSSAAGQLPLMMNELFTDKFQKMQEGHLYQRHPTILCKTLYHFCRWLFQERFTNLSLKFNTV